jgi:predicted deacetylase
MMLAQPSQYLLRFDDLCPTASRAKFERFLPMIREFSIKPILAVVPDNRDPDLMVSSPNPRFWHEMRTMENAGATIALHGFQHLCRSAGKALLPVNQVTEFAGVSEVLQREWIRMSLNIMRDHGLNPRLWVAPRHGFDHSTLRALRSEGITFISDGLARAPFSRGGVTWIPQQLWEPVERKAGLWTICTHSNTADDATVERLHTFVRQHASQFTSFDRICAEYSPMTLRASERIYEAFATMHLRASSRKRVLFRLMRSR